MAYSELIKNYERIRYYMRQFYVYGFKSRGEYDAKSARSYDNERRRIESWLGEYMCFRQDAGGKQVFLSVDSRNIFHNPLYQSFKAKSFTDKDITLHFYLLDILADGQAFSIKEIIKRLDETLSQFERPFPLDESTVRNKLREYEQLGLLTSQKQGRITLYQLPKEPLDLHTWEEALSFYSEENPLGVVGSFLLDQLENPPQHFTFKHHFLLHALDSQILCTLLMSIREHRRVEFTAHSSGGGAPASRKGYPMKIFISSQTGRQYLLYYYIPTRRLLFQRIDAIVEVIPGPEDPSYQTYEQSYRRFRKKLWGVSTGTTHTLEHLEMTIHINANEPHILQRLEREKRFGQVEKLDAYTYRFSADVYDATEMLPWLRTFIGRIVALQCSNQQVTDTFYADLRQMLALYGGADDAL